MRNPLLVAFACATLLVGQATAQMLPRPREVPPRVLDWHTTFPITPPFAQWTVFADQMENGRPVGQLLLHRNSLRWAAARELVVDILGYFDGTGGYVVGYRRFVVRLDCDESRLVLYNASASVVITPAGQLAPSGPVMQEGSTSRPLPNSSAWFDMLCYDTALRDRFLRRQ